MRSTGVFVACLWVSLAVMAACGGSDDPQAIDASLVALDGPVVDGAALDAPTDASAIDAPPDGLFGPCNPLAAVGQQGCDPGQKCTWVSVQDTPPLGLLACVPDGNVAVGDACLEGPPGQTTGFDNCAAGGICVGGLCKDICGFDGAAGAMCSDDFSCTRYSGVFGNGDDDPMFGACNPACDPVTQLQADGTMCPGGGGCYLLTDQTTTVAVCAGAGTIAHGQVITGQAFANSCVPGAQARRRDGTSSTVECGGLCRPADVTVTTNMTSEGGVSPNSCSLRWGTAPPSDTVQGESCRYWWAREPFDTLTPYSNTVGWCFKHAVFQYDTNGDQVPDAPFPRCAFVTTGDVLPPIGNPPHNDAQYFWCAALPATFLGSPLVKVPHAPEPRLDRLAQ